MYPWVVFLHVTGALLFFLAHGASVAVTLKLRSEQDMERIRALLDLSNYSLNAMWGVLLLLFLSGIIAGFMGNWWGQGWIWASLLLLVVSSVAGGLGANYFNHVRRAVGLPWAEGRTKHPAETPAGPEEIAELLSSSRPYVVAAIGIGGIVIITWLMMFKPF